MTARISKLYKSGFTIIELILVIFIMVLLTLMTLPMFAQFVKSSRVEQTAHIVCTTICRARQEAMRLHKMVGVFFGDELAKFGNPAQNLGRDRHAAGNGVALLVLASIELTFE